MSPSYASDLRAWKRKHNGDITEKWVMKYRWLNTRLIEQIFKASLLIFFSWAVQPFHFQSSNIFVEADQEVDSWSLNIWLLLTEATFTLRSNRICSYLKLSCSHLCVHCMWWEPWNYLKQLVTLSLSQSNQSWQLSVLCSFPSAPGVFLQEEVLPGWCAAWLALEWLVGFLQMLLQDAFMWFSALQIKVYRLIDCWKAG